MFAHHRKKIQLLFAIADAILTIAAFEAAYSTRTSLSFEKLFFLRPVPHILILLFSAVVWMAIGSFQRVYEYLDSAKPKRLAMDALRQAAIGIVLVIIFQYFLQLEPPLSRSFLLLFFVFNLFMIAAFRWYAPYLVGAFQRGFGSPYHIVLVGTPSRTAILEQQLCQNTPFRIQVSARLLEEECDRILTGLLGRQIVDEVIFDVDSSHLPALEEVLLHCDEEGVRTRVAIDFFPHVNSEITLDRVGNASLLTFSAAPMDDLRLVLKRAFDVVVSALALLLLSPLFLAICVLVKITSPGPVIFSQARCGLNGRRFTMYKFRSMVEDAEILKPQYSHLSQRTIAFKVFKDPRVTLVGRSLRRFSLDELPQLYNVLRGDMSIVGPRPPVPDEVDRYERWQRRRLRMRPGLTCLWAVSGRDRIDFNTWMRLDISYIENWSLGLDWSIILRTIPHVLAGRGAH